MLTRPRTMELNEIWNPLKLYFLSLFYNFLPITLPFIIASPSQYCFPLSIPHSISSYSPILLFSAPSFPPFHHLMHLSYSTSLPLSIDLSHPSSLLPLQPPPPFQFHPLSSNSRPLQCPTNSLLSFPSPLPHNR